LRSYSSSSSPQKRNCSSCCGTHHVSCCSEGTTFDAFTFMLIAHLYAAFEKAAAQRGGELPQSCLQAPCHSWPLSSLWKDHALFQWRMNSTRKQSLGYRSTLHYTCHFWHRLALHKPRTKRDEVSEAEAEGLAVYWLCYCASLQVRFWSLLHGVDFPLSTTCQLLDMSSNGVVRQYCR
jgi:hypothetical protein